MFKYQTIALLLAGGYGKRFQSETPKQFFDLKGKPIISYSIDAFEKSSHIDAICIVIPKDYQDYLKNVIKSNQYKKVLWIVDCGKERYDSVNNALQSIPKCKNLIIHDVARPLIDVQTIDETINQLNDFKAITVGVPSIDTSAVINNQNIIKTIPERKTIWNIQTPQAFHYELILDCYNKAIQENIQKNFTDDCGLVLHYYPECAIKMVQGSQKLKKITYPSDIQTLELFL